MKKEREREKERQRQRQRQTFETGRTLTGEMLMVRFAYLAS